MSLAAKPESDRLMHHPLFSGNPILWQMLSPVLNRKTFQKDQIVVRHGDKAGSLWLVLDGWLKLTRQTPDGKETIIGLCTENDMFGEAALFPHANYPYHAEVLGTGALLASVPADTIRHLIEKDSALSVRIMSLLNERISQTQLKLEQMSTMSAPQRLGCFLLRLCHTQASGSKVLQIPVEKHILAAYLGMKPETFSRSQQQLQPVGIKVEGHNITIHNIAQLREFVCNSCSESGFCEAEEDH
jgi:CRP/FNR family transcriptional regulator, dissimilatory nitrate respiration regulator